MRVAILIVALVLLSNPAIAADYWSHDNLQPKAGHNTATFTPTLATGDTESPTIEVSSCGHSSVWIRGATLTGYVQKCFGPKLWDAGIDEEDCTDLLLTGLDGASTPKGAGDIVGQSFLRIRGITNSNTDQYFEVTCGP